MNPTTIQSEIASAVDACYENPKKARRISLKVLRERGGRPCTVEGMADTMTEARAVFEDLKSQGRVTWYTVTQLNAGGPEWIRFALPPSYARQTVHAAPDSAIDGE